MSSMAGSGRHGSADATTSSDAPWVEALVGPARARESARDRTRVAFRMTMHPNVNHWFGHS